jgi:dehydrogenase/reductase SDR family protein 1
MPADGAPGTVEDTAAEISERGAKASPCGANLSDERQAVKLFERVAKDHGRLDVMANSAWSANVMAEWSTPFWELSPHLFRDTLDA